MHLDTDDMCLVRLTSFILRAIIAGPSGNNVDLLIGTEVLFAIGFFSLIYSTYNLVLDRYARLISSCKP